MTSSFLAIFAHLSLLYLKRHTGSYCTCYSHVRREVSHSRRKVTGSFRLRVIFLYVYQVRTRGTLLVLPLLTKTLPRSVV